MKTEKRGTVGGLFEHAGEMAADSGDCLLELVGQPGGQPAEDVQLLRVMQAHLEVFELADVARVHQREARAVDLDVPHDRVGEQPSCVVTAKTHPYAPWLQAVQRALENIGGLLLIVRVNQLGESEPEILVHLVARQLQGRVVGENNEAGFVEDHHGLAGGTDERLVDFLRSFQK